MNDIDFMVRETLELHADDVGAGPELVATAIRRSRTIHRRRVATFGAVAAVALGVSGVAAAAVLDHQDQDNAGSGLLASPTPSDTATPPAAPSPSPGVASGCATDQAPVVTAIGAATGSGEVKADGSAQTLTQAFLQSYLMAISNQEPVSDDGAGLDSTSHKAVVWVKFQDARVVEIVPEGNAGHWSSYRATLGPCAQVGS